MLLGVEGLVADDFQHVVVWVAEVDGVAVLSRTGALPGPDIVPTVSKLSPNGMPSAFRRKNARSNSGRDIENAKC
jgi:hypothetical protein